MEIKMIWASDSDGVIGVDGQLAQTSKADLQHFKELTSESGHNVIVMGRKTYQSIGKPLPNRFNIVLTKNDNWQFDKALGEELLNCHKSMSINDVLRTCEEVGAETLWVIGGKQIYEQFFDLADELVVTTFKSTSKLSSKAKNLYFTTFKPNLFTNFEPVDIKSLHDGSGTVITWRRFK